MPIIRQFGAPAMNVDAIGNVHAAQAGAARGSGKSARMAAVEPKQLVTQQRDGDGRRPWELPARDPGSGNDEPVGNDPIGQCDKALGSGGSIDLVA
jgi:hypothetical protein